MNRWIDHYCKALEVLVALALALMVIMVFGNVVLRYAFNSGITVSEELSRWLFVWMTFLGAVIGVRERGHLGTDMLVGRLGVAGKRVCLVVGQVLMLAVTWMLFRGSLEQTRINLDVEAPVTGAPMALVYAAGIVFAVSAGLMLLIDLLRTLRGLTTERELVMVQESEDRVHVAAPAPCERNGNAP